MQVSIFIIGVCALLLLISSLHFFFAKEGNHLLNRLLSVVFFSRFGHIIVYILITSGQLAIYPLFYKIFTPIDYAAPACLYLYVTGFINDRTQLRKLDWLHFIPVVLAIIHVLPWGYPPVNWDIVARQISEHKQIFIKQRTGHFPAYFYYLGLPALLLAYLVAAWRVVLTSQFIKQRGWEASKQWIFFFLSVSTFFKLIGILPLVFGGLHQPVAYWFVIINCLILLLVMVFLLHQPQLLYGYLFVATIWKANNIAQKEIVQFAGLPLNNSLPADQLLAIDTEILLTPPPAKNNLQSPSPQLIQYTEAMKEFMEAEKPFLLHGFQIVHLAQKLNIPVHHCSFVINNVIGKNFRDWINAYRINYFIVEYPILADKMTIEAIAYQSGFKNVATFYNAFKKETGLMPTTYFLKKEPLIS